jgi:hypothetical protein
MKMVPQFASRMLAVFGLIAAGSVQATGPFPNAQTDDPPMLSMGIFRITVAAKFQPLMTGYPGYVGGGKLYSPVVIDSSTVIGRSTVHNHGDAAPTAPGVPVGLLGTVVRYSDYSSVPPDFVGHPPLPATHEVFTEIRRMVLETTGLGACTTRVMDPRIPTGLPPGLPIIKAGPDSGAGVVPGPLPRSIGQAQSKQPAMPLMDFPARSFFDVFTEVALPTAGSFPGAVLRNTTPMVVTNQNLDAFPPVVVYTHSGQSAAPLVFTTSNPGVWVAGETFGHLVLAGHGTQLDCDNPAVVQAFIDEVLGPVNNEKPGLPVPPITPIPTVSEWGLILLALSLLVLGTVLLQRRVLAPGSVPAGWLPASPPVALFDGRLFHKCLLAAFAVASAGCGLAVWVQGHVAPRDVAGAILTAALAAYWVHLLVLGRVRRD